MGICTVLPYRKNSLLKMWFWNWDTQFQEVLKYR